MSSTFAAMVIRHLVRMIGDLVGYGVRTGRWWLLVSIVAFAGASVLVATAAKAAPVFVYTLF